jgi:hypothetical protein
VYKQPQAKRLNKKSSRVRAKRSVHLRFLFPVSSTPFICWWLAACCMHSVYLVLLIVFAGWKGINMLRKKAQSCRPSCQQKIQVQSCPGL